MKVFLRGSILGLLGIYLTSNGFAAQLLPPATSIVASISATVSLSPDAVFSYSYEIASSSVSAQDINFFAIKVGTVSQIQNFLNPPAWIGVPNTFGTRGLILWRGKAIARIKPGNSKTGFVLLSKNPPDIRDSLTRGFVHVEPVPFVDENTPAPRDTEKDSIHILTIGPSTFTFINPSSTIDRLITLKHQAVSLGWFFGPGADGIAKSLDAKLSAAKDSAGRGDNAAAANQLGAFINELDAQRGKHLNDNAYFLLKPNAQFIIRKLKP